MDVLIIFLSVPCYKAYPLHLLHLVLLLNTLKPKRRKAGKAAFTALCQSRTRLPPSAFLPHLFYTVGWQLGTLMSASLCLESVQVNWLMVYEILSLLSLPIHLPYSSGSMSYFCTLLSVLHSLPPLLCFVTYRFTVCTHMRSLWSLVISPLCICVTERESCVCLRCISMWVERLSRKTDEQKKTKQSVGNNWDKKQRARRKEQKDKRIRELKISTSTFESNATLLMCSTLQCMPPLSASVTLLSVV